MTTPTALIADDEALLAEGLCADLARLWPELRVVATAGDGAQAVEQALALRPTLCFLDIRMPGLSGLEAARALIEDWPDGADFPLLVFVTAYDEYALQAFDAEAVDYLLKPVEPARLEACVRRLQRTLASRAGAAHELEASVARLRGLLGATAAPAPAQPRLRLIPAQVGTTVHMVPVEDVVYFEAADKYVRVVTVGHEYLIRTSLRELLPQLDPAVFWQVHRGTVVQARCVASARRDESGKATLTLKGRPETIVASRLHAHLFKGL